MTPSAPFDVNHPNPARMFNYLVGGRDNYAVDREESARLLAEFPEAGGLAQASRAFICGEGTRDGAVKWLARNRGIGQFLDLGCGLPVWPGVHDAAREVIPAARVAYVDVDALVHVHVSALQASREGLAAVQADLRDVQGVLGDPALKGVIDLTEPVCVILAAVLQYISRDDAAQAIAAYTAALAPGSAVVISAPHYTGPGIPERMARLYPGRKCYCHSAADITRYLAGLELVREVGDACRWPLPPPATPKTAYILGAVGLKA